MSEPFLWGICLFILGLLVISVTNRLAIHKLGQFAPALEYPLVSVLVPARNEEANIEGCLRSLLAQDYPNFELLILNDDSEDGTTAILDSWNDKDERLHVYQGEPLPTGWLGKNWACAQLANYARGELLLFIDADTRHDSGTLSSAVAALLHERADLIAVWPELAAVSIGEKLVVPLISWCVFSILSIPLAHRLKFAPLSVAIGQFLLFRRSAYIAIGGHTAVRQHAAEDLALCRRVKRAGLRWRLVDGQQKVRTRMYRNFREAWRGLGKNLYAAFDYRTLLLVLAWLWLVVVAWSPLVVLGYAALGGAISETLLMGTLLAIGLMLAVWTINLLTTWQSPVLAVLYPLLLGVGFVVSLQSLVLTRAGLATWKGRRLETSGKAPNPAKSTR